MKTETLTLREGVTLTGYCGEYVFEKIKTAGDYYEKEILDRWYLPMADRVGTVVDVGANAGNHTVYFAAHSPQAQVYSIEPYPPNYALLMENVRRNRLEARVTTFPVALGEARGTARMSVEQEGNLGTAGISENGEIPVQLVPFDELGIPKADFLKIDVEGFELSVLKGMRRWLRDASPLIWVETSAEKGGELLAGLAELGFRPVDAHLELNGNLLLAREGQPLPVPVFEPVQRLLQKAEQYRELYWVKKSLGSMTSKFEYEQKKARELKKDLDRSREEAACREDDLAAALSHTEELALRLREAEDAREALAESERTFRERTAYFKALSEKHCSQFLYEQKKARELEARLVRYEQSKPYKVWLRYQRGKSGLRHGLYSFAHKLYYRLAVHPRILKLFSGANKLLHVFPDTSAVIFYGSPGQPQQRTSATDAQERGLPVPPPPKLLRDMNVAMIVDEFTYNSFRYECRAFPLEPDNWRKVFEDHQIDLFFCESAWTGTDPDRRPWRGQIYGSVNFPKENRTTLFEILDYCKARGIPTAFWNKEDPTHYEDRVHDFVNTALRFDHVFTTAEECVERYRRDYGHKSVHLLTFATQPRLFNPVERAERTGEVIFAGSWYRQHPRRCEEMSAIFDRILAQKLPLVIYDRQSENDDPNHEFPEKYKPYVRPRLRHDEMDAAYKGSRYALNINTVTDSPTMFARRVFELMSSNTLVISNYSRGMEELFGDNVIFTDGSRDIDLTDSEAKRDACLREVLSQHTYEKRFEQVVRECGISFTEETRDVTLLYRAGSAAEAEECVRHFRSITWVEKRMIILLRRECTGEDLRSAAVRFQSPSISVVSERYLADRGEKPELRTKYAVLADVSMKPDLPERSMLHWCYLPEGTGIADGEGAYRMEHRESEVNVIRPADRFDPEGNGDLVYVI